MHQASPFPASTLRPRSPLAHSSCEHRVYCECRCQALYDDPAELRCDPTLLPDEGGLTIASRTTCTPGEDGPHLLGCELIGWHVAVDRRGIWRS